MKLLTPFNPQLVSDSTINNMLYHNNLLVVEPKIDGIRAVIHKSGDVVKVFSRTGKDLTEKCSPILESIKEAISCKECVLDGELAVFKNNRPTTVYNVMRNNLESGERLVFVAFDILLLDTHQLFLEPLISRKQSLELALSSTKELMKINGIVSDNQEEVHDFYCKVLKAGFEGIVMKAPDKPYQFRRSFDWGRLKPIKTMDVKILEKKPRKGGKGFVYGFEGGSVISSIDLQVGGIVEIAYERLTDDGRVRMGRLIRQRIDNGGDK